MEIKITSDLIIKRLHKWVSLSMEFLVWKKSFFSLRWSKECKTKQLRYLQRHAVDWDHHLHSPLCNHYFCHVSLSQWHKLKELIKLLVTVNEAIIWRFTWINPEPRTVSFYLDLEVSCQHMVSMKKPACMVPSRNLISLVWILSKA